MLNPMQLKAVLHTQGQLLILAGAGSGKTRTLTHRAAQLVDLGVPPWQVLCITFTNKAAQEMKQRIEKLLGDAAKEMWISTFHSMCLRILRREAQALGYQSAFTVYDTDDGQRLLKQIMRNENVDEKKFAPRAVLSAISDAKNRMQTPAEMAAEAGRDLYYGTCAKLYDAYDRALLRNNAMDFDDLLINTVRLFEGNPDVLARYADRFCYIHVDEYQDTNRAQYLIVKMLARHGNLCVVGDDDQSIYGWRGADIQNILSFEADFPGCEVIRLEQNYRSTKAILDAANAVISHNRSRKGKSLWTSREGGEPVRVHRSVSERDEAEFVAARIEELLHDFSLSDIAVLYRTNAQSRVVEETLRHRGIPYRMVGGQKFYERKEIRDLIAYLRFLLNPFDSVSLLRIINVPKRGIGDTTVEKLAQHAASAGLPLWEAVCDAQNSGLNRRAAEKLQAFAGEMIRLMAQSQLLMPEEFVRTVIETAGLLLEYEQEGSMESEGRMENIMEFVNAVRDYMQEHSDETIEDYLNGIVLSSDIDDYDEMANAVTLMTLHSAKGLEFRVIFLTGLEEGLCPHTRSFGDEFAIEEERRLCYVGFTRAMDRLYLSYALSRGVYGTTAHNPPSRFLSELPEAGVQRDDQNGASKTGGEIFSRSYSPTRPVITRPAIVPPPQTELLSLGVGDKVHHPAFGGGEVLGLSGKGDGVVAEIDFGGKGVKRIMLKYAAMKKV
jgi:DNA helicase-2/ATP-dependent DNA helicase PcrA